MLMRCDSVSQASASDCTMASVCVHHEHFAAVDAVDDHARQWRQQERGNLPGEPDRAQQQRRFGQPVDEPRRGDAGHPRADERNALAAKEEAEIAMPQRAPGVRKACVLRGGRAPPM